MAYVCNKCYQLRVVEQPIKFYFSHCGHIFCERCVKDKCLLCGSTYRPVVIEKHMPTAAAMNFADPLALHQRFLKVVQFQVTQDAIKAHAYVNVKSAALKRTKKQLEAFKKLEAKFDAEIDKEQKRIKKLKTYLAFHERRQEQKRNLATATATTTSNMQQRYEQKGSHNDSGLSSATATLNSRTRPKTPTLSSITYSS